MVANYCEVNLKRILLAMIVLVGTIGLVACGDNANRNDVTRFVQGDNPSSTILSSPVGDESKFNTETYLLCTSEGELTRAYVDRNNFYSEPRKPEYYNFPASSIICGEKVKQFEIYRKTLRQVLAQARGESGGAERQRLDNIIDMISKLNGLDLIDK